MTERGRRRAVLGDVLVYDEDVDTLLPGKWLNDQVIAYLLGMFDARRESSDGVVVLEPSMTFTAGMVGEAELLREMLSVARTSGATPLAEQLGVADLVLMPVNNNEDASIAGGGSHWSLLAFRRQGGQGGKPRFEHYDSCDNANGPQASPPASRRMLTSTARRARAQHRSRARDRRGRRDLASAIWIGVPPSLRHRRPQVTLLEPAQTLVSP